jgi:uncharacterized protein
MVPTMQREEVIARLKPRQTELNRAGVVSLAVFGSVARGDAGASSDVDLMAEFDEARRLSLLELVGLQNRLTEIIGSRVDLADRRNLKEFVKPNAEREAVVVF